MVVHSHARVPCHGVANSKPGGSRTCRVTCWAHCSWLVEARQVVAIAYWCQISTSILISDGLLFVKYFGFIFRIYIRLNPSENADHEIASQMPPHLGCEIASQMQSYIYILLKQIIIIIIKIIIVIVIIVGTSIALIPYSPLALNMILYNIILLLHLYIAYMLSCINMHIRYIYNTQLILCHMQ